MMREFDLEESILSFRDDQNRYGSMMVIEFTETYAPTANSYETLSFIAALLRTYGEQEGTVVMFEDKSGEMREWKVRLDCVNYISDRDFSK